MKECLAYTNYSNEHVLDREYEARLHDYYRYPPYWL
jgi:hypothetical protein